MNLNNKRVIWISVGLFVICLSALFFMHKHIHDEITQPELEELLGVSLPYSSEFFYRRCEHRSGVFEALNGDQVTINEQFIMFSGTEVEADNLAQALKLRAISSIDSYKLSPTTCVLDWWEDSNFKSAYYWDSFTRLPMHPNLSGCFYVALASKDERIFIQLTDMGHDKCGNSS